MGCQIRRILQFNEAIVFQEVKIFDFDSVDITRDCMYSWSTDTACWTGWTTYDNYISICKNFESAFYLRVLLFGSFEKVFIGTDYTTCYTICLDSTNPFLQDFCGQPNIFQPYNNLDCALLLQQQMSDSVICMFGIPIYYLRVQPNIESANYTFKEYPLHDIVDIKQMKMMIEDGTMPSSNPKLTDFDFDWESDWNVEISKNQFAQAFGDLVFPKQRDLVYVPLMKRLWEINSAYDEKNEGLLWRPTTWKLAMSKYNEKTNIDQGGFESLIDGWAINTYENTFEERERNEQERLTAEFQVESPTFAANCDYADITMQDAVRLKYTKDTCNITDRQLYHRSSIVARNVYNFGRGGQVIYQKGACGTDGTLSFIITVQNSLETDFESTIVKFGEISVKLLYDKATDKYSISFNGISCVLEESDSSNEQMNVDTFMVIAKWNKNNFVSELCVYPYKCNDNVPIYLRNANMYYFDYESPVCELTAAYNHDFEMTAPQNCSISAWPALITNIKYYNVYLDKTEAIKEVTKYTTQHENCIINDLARPVTNGLGYVVK